jgi:hypothetical protein
VLSPEEEARMGRGLLRAIVTGTAALTCGCLAVAGLAFAALLYGFYWLLFG